jgi:hypothetical protein
LRELSTARTGGPPGVLAAANDAFLNGLEVVAATGAVLMGLVAAVAVVTLRHIGRPDAGQSIRKPAVLPATVATTDAA